MARIESTIRHSIKHHLREASKLDQLAVQKLRHGKVAIAKSLMQKAGEHYDKARALKGV